MIPETIEQAAERIFPSHKGLTVVASNKIMMRRAAFIKGAKWMLSNMSINQISNKIKE